MSVIQILDHANEYRITVSGELSGDRVNQLAAIWAEAHTPAASRRIIVDVSYLSGYDQAGCKLLRRMHRHGTDIAAATASSLVFLAEITAPRRGGVTVIPEGVPERTRPGREDSRAPLMFRTAASK